MADVMPEQSLSFGQPFIPAEMQYDQKAFEKYDEAAQQQVQPIVMQVPPGSMHNNMMPMQQNGQMQQNMMPQMMQQFVQMAMPQGWGQDFGMMNGGQMMNGQAPAGYVFVPMSMDMNGQPQMMFDQGFGGPNFYGQQMNGQMMNGQMMQNGMDEMGMRRGGNKPWRKRGEKDGRRAFAADDTKKVFVGGLGPATSAKSLRQYFSQFGQLVDAAVIADGATRRSRGFGFVEFAGGIPQGVLDREHLIEQRRCGVRPYTYRQEGPRYDGGQE